MFYKFIRVKTNEYLVTSLQENVNIQIALQIWEVILVASLAYLLHGNVIATQCAVMLFGKKKANGSFCFWSRFETLRNIMYTISDGHLRYPIDKLNGKGQNRAKKTQSYTKKGID